MGESSRIATAMVSYAEARATFARLLREEDLSEEEHPGIVEAPNRRWRTYEKPAVTENLVPARWRLRAAPRPPGLRLHPTLASAFVCQGRNRDLRFLAFDDDLEEAAEQVMVLYEASN